jgi:L-threonylcarbamoyladenylate synthase
MNFETDIKEGVDALKAGKVILYPTDTVWGLGCDPKNEDAIRRILEIKGRQAGKGMILLIERIEQLRDYVFQIPDIAWDIVDFAEKPLTVVYPKGKNISPMVTAEDGSIAIRMVKDDFCKALIRKFGRAILSTSANKSGSKTPGNFSQIENEIISQVDYTVKHKREEKALNESSSILRIGLKGEVQFIRK